LAKKICTKKFVPNFFVQIFFTKKIAGSLFFKKNFFSPLVRHFFWGREPAPKKMSHPNRALLGVRGFAQFRGKIFFRQGRKKIFFKNKDPAIFLF